MNEKDCGCYVQVSLGVGCRDRSECKFDEAVELIRKLKDGISDFPMGSGAMDAFDQACAFLKRVDGVVIASGTQ